MLYSALNAQGFHVTWNATGFISGDNNSNPGTTDLYWHEKLFPYGEAAMVEYCQWRDNFPQGPDIRRMGPEWWNLWDGWQRIMAQAKTASEGTLCNRYSVDAADREYVMHHSCLIGMVSMVLWLQTIGIPNSRLSI